MSKRDFRSDKSANYSRRHFIVRSASSIAGALMSTYGMTWGDLAYGQQLKGQAAKFNVAVRPDWTQGWFGMINEEKGIWRKYLPPGSEVTFSHPIQGGIVTSELVSDKTQIGHNGDAPGLIATFQRDRADIRIIALVGSSPGGYHCYQIMVRPDAPQFKSSKEAIKWLDGKVVACPKGSCTDRFFQEVLAREGSKPKEYLNQPIGVITTQLRGKRIDGAATWDPQGAAVSTVAGSGDARLVATGYPWGERDSGVIIWRRDFMERNREVTKAWLKSEIETQMWYYDPKNHAEVLHIAQKYVKGFSHKALWFSMCGLLEEPYFGGPIRDEKPFVMNDDVMNLHKKVVKYLAEIKVVPSAEIPAGAHDDSLAREAMKEMGLSSPVARMKAVPLAKGYSLVQDPKRIEEYAALFKM
jgi:NitT/TauT family transport system substrate-binding protein